MARKKDPEDQETNLLPVMNIMLLIIPALLLAMEVARMGAIDVRPPIGAKGGVDPTTKDKERLELRVFIAEDGYELAPTTGAQTVHRIELADASRPTHDPKRWDLPALEAEATRLKALGFEPLVRVDAEGSVPMATLVATLDALRGSDCQLGRVGPGENVPESCLFYSVVMEPGSRAG